MFLNPDYPLDLYVKYFFILSARYFLFAGLAYFIFWKWLKPWIGKFKQQGFSTKPGQIKREIFYSMLTNALFGTNGLYLVYMGVKQKGLFYKDVSEYGVPYLIFSLFFIFFLNDLNFYWTHRILHLPWFFKKFHWIHHESRNTTPWTSFSFHPIEAVVNTIFVFAFPWIIPVHFSVIPLFALGSFLWNVYGHSGYDVVPIKWLKKAPFSWFLPSRYHNLHHEKITGNYGLYFSLWDRVSGTLREPVELANTKRKAV